MNDATAVSPWNASTDDEDIERLRVLHRDFVAANAVSDPGFLAEYTAPGPDALTWFNLNGSNYLGVAHITQLWEAIRSAFAGGQARVTSSDERITVVGDVGWVEFQMHYAADFGELGGKVAEAARGTEIWRRLDGDWRLVHGHFSTHVPDQMGGH